MNVFVHGDLHGENVMVKLDRPATPLDTLRAHNVEDVLLIDTGFSYLMRKGGEYTVDIGGGNPRVPLMHDWASKCNAMGPASRPSPSRDVVTLLLNASAKTRSRRSFGPCADW